MNIIRTAQKVGKAILPEGLKARLRPASFRLTSLFYTGIRSADKIQRIRHAIDEAKFELSAGAEFLSPAALERLSRAWDNPGWEASYEYLEAVSAEAANAKKVLECGSGLTSAILGIYAEHLGTNITSLEQNKRWADYTASAIGRCIKLGHLNIVHAPIVDHGCCQWYSTDSIDSASKFDLVICDGPVISSRIGLLTLLYEQLSERAVILLDDVAAEKGKEVIDEWNAIYNLKVDIQETERPFARIEYLGKRMR